MSAFALPLVIFTGGLIWLLVSIIRGSFEDPYPLRAGVTWAVTCPIAGLLFGIGAAPLAFVVGTVSMLALGSLGYWFLVTEPDDTDDTKEHTVAPDPGPSDDEALELPAWAKPAPEPGIDWAAFDRARETWKKITGPRRRPAKVPQTEPEKAPQTEPEKPPVSV